MLETSLITTETVGQNRAWQSIKSYLLGLADWHRDQAAEQQRQENIYQLSELTEAAEKALTNTNQ